MSADPRRVASPSGTGGTATYLGAIQSGKQSDGRPFVPGINCITCGRFVGRDGQINVEYFEMSSEVASIDGECGSCIRV